MAWAASYVYGVTQGSPTFLKTRATSWELINAKGYQFGTHFWNNQFAQNTFKYTLVLIIINDIHICEDTDHVKDFS